MSVVEYNNLLFKISQRLNELRVGKQLLVMCRGKVALRSEENMEDAFSLFEELEENGFLGPNRVDILKAMLKGVNEWPLFEEVERFESKRKEYNGLLEQIIRELDELNDLERLISICIPHCSGTAITEGRQTNINDVRSLFKELEINNCLGVDCLGIVKEILTQTDKSDLHKEVEEFEKRRTQEDKFERRRGICRCPLLLWFALYRRHALKYLNPT